jgi:hypothetical protein
VWWKRESPALDKRTVDDIITWLMRMDEKLDILLERTNEADEDDQD